MWGICLTGYRGLSPRVVRCAGRCVDWAKKGVFAGAELSIGMLREDGSAPSLVGKRR
jgi:hypothetical protein